MDAMQDMYIISKHPSIRYLLITKGNSTRNGTNQQDVPPGTRHLEGHSFTSVIFLPKVYNLNLFVSKHQTNSS